MKRRSFLKAGPASGLVFYFAGLSGCDRQAAPSATSKSETSTGFPLEEMDVTALQEKMQQGVYTSRQVCQLYLDRIGVIDKSGPFLNSVIELNPDALSLADQLDEERKQGKVRGILHGIPVLIKDNIDTGDNMMTTAGALAMVGNKAPEDAFIVAKLRAAGAVILGKTNLSEWANFRSNRSSSGWSSRGGQTKNPYVLERNPCGSSSGSGTAVSANLCAVAIGTETNGSISCPSSINGIVGIKPTVGLVSRNGIIPISHTQDTAGPMARTVKDAAVLLGVMTGIDPEDAVTEQSKDRFLSDYVSFLDPNGLQGKRIGVEKSMLKNHEGVDILFANAIQTLSSKGATIVEVEFMSKVKDIGSSEFAVLQYEFKDGLNRYLATHHAPVKNLEEIIKFNKAHEPTAMPYFKQDILESSQEKGDLKSDDYRNALDKILTTTRKALDYFLKTEKLDALCGPTNGPSWCTDLVNGDSFTGYGVYAPASIAGYPHITVPMGRVFDLPVGLSFLGGPYSEGMLIKLAYAYEQASRHRSVPTFRSSLPSQ